MVIVLNYASELLIFYLFCLFEFELTGSFSSLVCLLQQIIAYATHLQANIFFDFLICSLSPMKEGYHINLSSMKFLNQIKMSQRIRT